MTLNSWEGDSPQVFLLGRRDWMARYYVGKAANKNGEHEVHKEGCAFIPEPGDRVLLGDFNTCFQAILEAHKGYRFVNGCQDCSEECHAGRSEAAFVVGQSR